MHAHIQFNHCQAYRGRIVTYQMAFRGKDGIVIASDQRDLLTPQSSDEGTGAKLILCGKSNLIPRVSMRGRLPVRGLQKGSRFPEQRIAPQTNPGR